ncbi:MAG TPA: PAS domain S-box protein, partial [Vicinamibacteria bacterium]|nr:PAS domain S-box protein [Vicinamibacteria bacterium]
MAGFGESLDLLLETSPQPVCVIDPASFRFLAVNEAAVRLYGYSEPEFLALTLPDLYPPEDAPALLAALRTAPAREVAAFETPFARHRRKGGMLLDVEVSWSPVVVGERHVLIASINDTTERRLAEEALWASEERIRALISAAPVVLFAVDQNGVFTLSEGRGLAVLGLNPGQVVGQSLFELYRDVPAILDATHRALAGESLSAEIELGPLTLEGHFAPLRDPARQIVGAFGVGNDVTERRRAERALEEQRAFLRRVIDTNPGFIFAKDREGRFTLVN